MLHTTYKDTLYEWYEMMFQSCRINEAHLQLSASNSDKMAECTSEDDEITNKQLAYTNSTSHSETTNIYSAAYIFVVGTTCM